MKKNPSPIFPYKGHRYEYCYKIEDTDKLIVKFWYINSRYIILLLLYNKKCIGSKGDFAFISHSHLSLGWLLTFQNLFVWRLVLLRKSIWLFNLNLKSDNSTHKTGICTKITFKKTTKHFVYKNDDFKNFL